MTTVASFLVIGFMLNTASHFWQSARRYIPVIIGLGLFAAGIYALYGLLRPVDPTELAQQLRDTPKSALLIAVGATIVAYVSLMGYDFLALKYLEKPLPNRVVIIGSFLGYAFGNTIGISILSGGAVRYRIYAAAGLNAFDVAALSGYISVAMGIGMTFVGLVALGFFPDAIGAATPLSPATIQWVSILWAASMAGSIVWLATRKSPFRFRQFTLAMPNMRIILAQLFFTAIDTMMAAATLYVLLPDGGPSFMAFVGIFAAATMAGVISHVPGGLGVFETVVIAAMPAGVPVTEIAAALLLYRMIYFLLPFAVAFALVSLNEARLASKSIARLLGDAPDTLRAPLRALTGVAPILVGTAVFVLGGYLLLLSVLPSVGLNDPFDHGSFAVFLIETSVLITAFLGVALLILSHGLIRRISAAYWLTLIALGGGALAALLNNGDFHAAVILAASCLTIVPFGRSFYRQAKLTDGLFSPAWFALVFAFLVAALTAFFFVHAATPYSAGLWLDFGADANTPRALRAGLVASLTLVVFMVYLSLQPTRRRPANCDPALLDRAAEIAHHHNQPAAFLALSGDKWIHMSDARDAFIMYGRRGASWVALGDPIGNPDSFAGLAWDFVEEALKANCRPVFYEVGEANLPLWIEMGLSLHKVGEEAIIDLSEFSLSGAKFKTMRAAFNKKAREGYDITLEQAPHSPGLIAELEQVSTAWLGSKTGREKGFSVGRFDPAYLAHFPIAVVRNQGRIVAFANILSPNNGDHVAIDLMRYLPQDASGMIEYLFLSLIHLYQEQGAKTLSLGVAPLSGIQPRKSSHLWNRFGALMFRHGGAFYNFEGLRGFKQKFQPNWHPRYVALPVGISPMMAMADVALLISGGARGLVKR